MKAVLQASALTATNGVQVAPGASVTVRTPGGALADLWEDRNGETIAANPATADVEGFFRVYANPGRYHVVVSAASGTREFRDVALWATGFSEADLLAFTGAAAYEDTAAGLADTEDGEFFWVPSEEGDLILYRNDDGTAVEEARLPNSARLDDAVLAAQQAAESAEEDAADAEVFANAAEDARGITEGYRDESETFRNQARDAAEASGDVRFFDTFAEADAATLNEGQVVEVFEDETRGGARTRYRVESGVLEFKVAIPRRGVIYAASVDDLLDIPGAALDAGQQAIVEGSLLSWDGSEWMAVDHVNVRSFGAVGDGETDDSAAVQAAIDFISDAGVVFFPKGHYRIQGVDPKADIVFKGQGWRNSILSLPDGATQAMFPFAGSGTAWMTSFHELQLRGNGKEGPDGIDLSNSSQWRHAAIRDCFIHEFGRGIVTSTGDRRPYIAFSKIWDNGVGIHILGSSHPQLSNCDLRGNDVAIKGNPLHFLFSDCTWVRNERVFQADVTSFREGVINGGDLAANKFGFVIGRGCVVSGLRISSIDGDFQDEMQFAIRVTDAGCNISGINIQDDNLRFQDAVISCGAWESFGAEVRNLSVSGVTSREPISKFIRFDDETSIPRNISVTGNTLKITEKFVEFHPSNNVQHLNITGNTLNIESGGSLEAGDAIIDLPNGNSNTIAFNNARSEVDDLVFYRGPGENSRIDNVLTPNLSVDITSGLDTVSAELSGEFTPVLEGSSVAGEHTYTRQFGRWYRIGRMWVAKGELRIDSLDASAEGDVRIVGIPFDISQETIVALQATHGITPPSGVYQIVGAGAPGGTAFRLTGSRDNGAIVQTITFDNINDNFRIRFTAVSFL